MAEIAVLIPIVQAIVDSASRIRDLGESYYQATEAWNDFPTKVRRLHITHKVWVEALDRVGASDKDVIDTLNETVSSLNEEEGKRLDREEPEVHQTSTIRPLETLKGATPTLRNELTRAISALNEEEKNLENMHADRKIKSKGIKARVSRLFSKTHAVVFPGTLGRRLQRLVEVLDAIPNLLESKQKAKAAAEKLSLSTPYRILFHDDKRYVHLDDTEREIQSKLENSAGPAMVLLHGGTGKGKSTLARHVALYYDQQTPATPTFFQQVIFLKCGPNVVTLDMQLEILQWLAINTQSSEVNQLRNSARRVAHQLKSALTSRRILIIFDDVWENGFLHDMIKLFGENVKCLVTSQNDKLCSGLSSAHPVLIQNISNDAAKKIVAGHVGFQDQFIPDPKIEDIVDRILSKTGPNPLAIASVVSAVNEKRKGNPEEWNDVYQEFEHSLKTTPIPRIFHEEYSQSFWAAKKVSVRSLRADAKRVLLLMHLCKGPSVPVAVIRFLYETESREEIPFRYAADEVEGRELVQMDNSKTERSWSTHFVQNLFMNDDEDMKKQKEEVFEILEGLFCTTETRLSGAEIEIGTELQCEDALIKTILCALYFEDQFAKKATSKLNVTDGRLNASRRSAFEPITTLLGLSQSDKWTLEGRTVTKSALRNYFCLGKLDDENIAFLLNMSIYPPAQLTALAAVNNNLLMQEFPIITERSRLLTGIVKFLYKHNQPDTQKQAARALGNLANGAEPCKLQILQQEGALEGLVNLLCKDNQPDTQKQAARALGNLANGEEPCKLQILQQEGALEGLVNLLCKDNQPDTQREGAWALVNLANGEEPCKLKILQQEGALEGLVNLLCKDNQPDTQKVAAMVLRNLATGTEPCKLQILQQEGALEGLVNLLCKDNQPATQREGACALVNLASGEESCELKILQQEGALEGLVKLLCKDNRPDTQKMAACALVNLAAAAEPCKLQILQQEGALEGLVKLLCKDNQPATQREAARALGYLASGEEPCKLQILQQEGALEGLVNLLCKDNQPDTQKLAACALVNLAAGAEPCKLQILQQEGALEGLVKLLCKDNRPDTQEQAARALGYLASGEEPCKLQILQQEGALEGLVNLLCKDNQPDTQKQAASALGNLAAGAEPCQLKILQQEGALEGLVKLLCKDNQPDTQKQAAWALGNLASGAESWKLKIFQQEGALEGLVNLLCKDNQPDTQTDAARALANLAGGGEPCKLKIMEQEGALEGLKKLLSKDYPPDTQMQAARAWASIQGTKHMS